MENLGRSHKPMPEIVALCPAHPDEFYVPHSGTCPACSETLVEYVPAANLKGAVEAAQRTLELEAALEARLDGDERLAEYAEAVAALRAAVGGQ